MEIGVKCSWKLLKFSKCRVFEHGDSHCQVGLVQAGGSLIPRRTGAGLVIKSKGDAALSEYKDGNGLNKNQDSSNEALPTNSRVSSSPVQNSYLRFPQRDLML